MLFFLYNRDSYKINLIIHSRTDLSKKLPFFIILFIISSIFYFPIINTPLGLMDEGLILVGAERTLKGDVPYRDFFLMYTPGQTYIIAALFKVFGTSVVVERVYDIIIKSLLSLSVYMSIRLLCSNITALTGWAMSLIWVGASSFPAYPVYPALLCMFAASYCLILHLNRGQTPYVALCSIFIVLAIMFRHDLGGVAAIAITLVLLLSRVMRVQRSWTPLMSYIIYGVLAALPVLAYLYMNSAMESMIEYLLLFPLTGFGDHYSFPYPSLNRNTLPFYVFPAVLLTGIISSVIMIKSDKNNISAYGVLLISLFGTFFLNQARVRSDMIHLLPAALTGIVLAPILLHMLPEKLSMSKKHKNVLIVLFIIVFSATLYNPASKILMFFPGKYTLQTVTPDIPRVKHLKISSDLKNAVAYIKSNTPEDSAIYVGVKNHDKLVFNHVAVYFLAERKSATRYHELSSGLTNTLAIQEEMVEELKDNSVKLIVLTPGPAWGDEPNLSSIDDNIDLLDNYITSNFKLREKYGVFEIWIRKT